MHVEHLGRSACTGAFETRNKPAYTAGPVSSAYRAGPEKPCI